MRISDWSSDVCSSDLAADNPAQNCFIVVAAPLVDGDGRLLVQRRPEGRSMSGLWEFPGGQIEAAETPQQALVRDLTAELATAVQAACLAPARFARQALGSNHLPQRLYLHTTSPCAPHHR